MCVCLQICRPFLVKCPAQDHQRLHLFFPVTSQNTLLSLDLYFPLVIIVNVCAHTCICVCVCVRALSLTHVSYGASVKMFTSITLCPKYHSMSQILVLWTCVAGFFMHIVNYHSLCQPCFPHKLKQVLYWHTFFDDDNNNHHFSETLYPSITWHTALCKHLHLINQIHTLTLW